MYWSLGACSYVFGAVSALGSCPRSLLFASVLYNKVLELSKTLSSSSCLQGSCWHLEELLLTAVGTVLECRTGSRPAMPRPSPGYHHHTAAHLLFVRVTINLPEHPQESDLFSSS